jgi:hypothetical protein
MTPQEEFEAFINNVFRTIAPGHAFILGVADNTMPGCLIDRIERITELVEKYGTYPALVEQAAHAQ